MSDARARSSRNRNTTHSQPEHYTVTGSGFQRACGHGGQAKEAARQPAGRPLPHFAGKLSPRAAG